MNAYMAYKVTTQVKNALIRCVVFGKHGLEYPIHYS